MLFANIFTRYPVIRNEDSNSKYDKAHPNHIKITSKNVKIVNCIDFIEFLSVFSHFIFRRPEVENRDEPERGDRKRPRNRDEHASPLVYDRVAEITRDMEKIRENEKKSNRDKKKKKKHDKKDRKEVSFRKLGNFRKLNR